jgi:outer membrane biosynthesis protein TonB
VARARRANNHRPPDRDSLLGAGILSAVLHVAAIVATFVVWPFIAPPAELPSDIVPVDALTVAEYTNIMAQQESKEAPPPDPQPVPMPPIEATPPEFEEPPPPEPDAEAALEPEEKPPEPEPPKPQPPQPRFAMATPRAKPKPEPKKQEFDLSQIDEAIERAEKQQPKEDTPQPAAKQTTKGVGAQSSMTMSEIDALRSQMSKCWNVPVGAPDPTALVLRVRVFFNEDGTVASAPQLVDQGRLGDPYFRAAADAAIRAVHLCGPYNLPPEKYATWNEIVITFDPREMAGY